MEPGGTLEERADVTRQKLLNYIKFRREEEKMKFKIGTKSTKPQIPGAGDWNVTYVDPTTAVNRFTSIKSAILDERSELLGQSSSVPTIHHTLSKPSLSQTMSNLGIEPYNSEFDIDKQHSSSNNNGNNNNNSNNDNNNSNNNNDNNRVLVVVIA